MGYVIAAIVAVVIIGGFIVFLVMNATKKSNVSDSGDPGADQNPLGILGSDDRTPAGSTDQLSSEQERVRFERNQDSPDVARPVVGGEAEGERSAH
ncbi:hypothetical protein OJ997_32360 [Solirubrobacter phytolaccae]|uniref:Uncharacterized protein n=1 Tax=Solirubrobacter phytolaccae TaxID=1404360 RepID=A0A9X3SBU3_9ACTN|nr:hypothetical protein [Solirubrobacter phytolaccae]MDA0185043.1 hypothetical protein [Solirubrobacter phytolaccae]